MRVKDTLYESPVWPLRLGEPGRSPILEAVKSRNGPGDSLGALVVILLIMVLANLLFKIASFFRLLGNDHIHGSCE